MAHWTNVYIRKTKLSSYEQYLFGLSFSSNAKKAHIDQITLQLLPRLKKASHKASKAEKLFCKSLCYWYSLLRLMFFIPCDNWKNIFYTNLSLPRGFLVTARLLFSLKQVFWKKPVFSVRYLHNNITALLIPKVQTKVFTS